MAHHFQIACNLGHQVSGPVVVVVVHILALDFVIQEDTHPVHHVLGGSFVLHVGQISETRPQKRKSDHGQTQGDEKRFLGAQVFQCTASRDEGVHNLLADVRVYYSERGCQHGQAEGYHIPCPVPFQILPQPLDLKHVITRFLCF
ncbi:hypothetical protein D3C71_1568190 [compost metagenome]